MRLRPPRLIPSGAIRSHTPGSSSETATIAGFAQPTPTSHRREDGALSTAAATFSGRATGNGGLGRRPTALADWSYTGVDTPPGATSEIVTPGRSLFSARSTRTNPRNAHLLAT